MKALIAALAVELASPAIVHAQSKALLIFGGEDHKDFLGCLNCSKYDSSSVCNKYGDQGNKYNDKSISNRYGTYGSRFNSESPWSKYSASPLVAIVDKDGGFYGYLTANHYAEMRTTIAVLNSLADAAANGDDLDSLRDLFCGE